MEQKFQNDVGAVERPLTALDLALTKNKPDDWPATTGYLTRIRNGRRPAHGEALHELQNGKQVQVTSTTTEALIWNVGVELCSPANLVQLRNQQAWMEASLKESNKWSLSNVNAALHRERDQIFADALDGKPLAEEIQSSSREAAQLNHRYKMAALDEARRRFCHEQIIPIVKPILEQFEKVVEDFMRQQEECDRSMCVGFGLEYQPSILWKAAATIAQRYTAKSRLPGAHAWSTPRSLLEGLVQI